MPSSTELPDNKETAEAVEEATPSLSLPSSIPGGAQAAAQVAADAISPINVDNAIDTAEDAADRNSPIKRSNSSFRARLKASRRQVSGLTSGINGGIAGGVPASLFRWETRGHFWSALDKAVAPAAPSQAPSSWRGVVSRWCQAGSVRTKNTLVVVRMRPSVLLWPLLLGAACIGLGVMGVQLGAAKYERHHQDKGRVAAAKAANSLQLAVERSLQPLRSVELLVQLAPGMAELGPALPRIAARPLAQAPPLTLSLFLSPFGVVRAAYTPGYQAAASAVAAAIPPPGTELMPEEGFKLPQLQDILLRTPDWLPPRGASQPTLLAAHRPVLLTNTPSGETWGNGGPCGAADGAATGTAPGDGHCLFQPNGNSSNSPNSPNGPNGTRLWGYVSSLLEVTELAALPAAGLSALQELGYLYRLTVRADPPSAAAVARLVSAPAPGGTGGQSLRVPVLGAVWELEVEREGGYRPEWEAPLIAVVVVVSLALSALLFAALVVQHRHLMLLEAMLPKKVIKQLGMGRSFYEHYESVTVLYADIVRYSNAPTGMPPWEVVKLLNDVHNIYDGLLEKHGLTKIRRSGEAFMGVGGCPTAEDPVKAALRVALCAREMVMATAGFRSSAGQRVQIRLGLHSGPAVAAVVGTHMPRFSLFGDTIDIAHFMEATSTIMGVHVSDTTAELLHIADDPILICQPRGIIDVKGRGPMTTSWLRIDILAPMATFREMHSSHLTAAAAATANATANAANDRGSNGNGGGGGGGGGGGPQRGSGAAAAGTSTGRNAGGGEDRSNGARGGGGGGADKGGPKESPADIACTADLAVAASMGVRGAPLVRKLSQTGLTQTRKALPDRRAREGLEAQFEHSLLGSFTLRLELETLAMVKTMLGRKSGEGGKGAEGGGGSGGSLAGGLRAVGVGGREGGGCAAVGGVGGGVAAGGAQGWRSSSTGAAVVAAAASGLGAGAGVDAAGARGGKVAGAGAGAEGVGAEAGSAPAASVESAATGGCAGGAGGRATATGGSTGGAAGDVGVGGRSSGSGSTPDAEGCIQADIQLPPEGAAVTAAVTAAAAAVPKAGIVAAAGLEIEEVGV